MDDGRPIAVVTGAVNASLPDPGVLDYTAAKAALENFAKSLSKEVGPAGIRVNGIDPGPVATDLWLGEGGVAQTLSAAGAGAPTAIADAAVATRRFTHPQEVAEIVALLAGDRVPNLTGAAIRIDRGLVPTI